jgi:hypothetical protein
MRAAKEQVGSAGHNEAPAGGEDKQQQEHLLLRHAVGIHGQEKSDWPIANTMKQCII